MNPFYISISSPNPPVPAAKSFELTTVTTVMLTNPNGLSPKTDSLGTKARYEMGSMEKLRMTANIGRGPAPETAKDKAGNG